MGLNNKRHIGASSGLGSPLFGVYTSGLTLNSIFSSYFTNMWSAENINTPSTQNALTIATDELLNIDDVLTALASTTTGTISFWFKTPDITPATSNSLWCFGDTDADTYMAMFMVNSAGSTLLRINTRVGGTKAWELDWTTATLRDNTIYHVAITQDGVAPKLYVNNVNVGSFNVSTDTTTWFNTYPTLDNGRIGCRNVNSGGDDLFADITITDILFTSDAKDANGIADIYNDGVPKDESGISNAVAYYRFNNVSDNYNSDVANEWNLYDEISSIESYTDNCEEADITSASVQAELVAYDYGESHNLISGVHAKPTINSSDSNFNNKQSLTFALASSQGLEKTTSNFRGSDNTGMITFVCRPVVGEDLFPFSSSDEATATRYISAGGTGSTNFGRLQNGGGTAVIQNTANSTVRNIPQLVCTIISNGSGFRLFVNGIEQNTSNLNDDGRWFNDYTTLDNIAIGLVHSTSITYGSMDWVLTGYTNSVLSDANIVSLHQDLMNYYRMSVELAISELNQINGILHGWNYKFLSEIGTTTTEYDLLGSYDMANPGAGSQPTLNATNLEFDGSADYIINNIANYRSADTSGVIHCYMQMVSSVNAGFASSDAATNNYNLRFGLDANDKLEARYIEAGATSLLTSTNAYTSGFHVLTFACNGSDNFMYYDGVKLTDFDTDTAAASWFASVTNRDNISKGAIVRSGILYRNLFDKGTFHTAWVDDNTVALEVSKILNSGL